MKTSSILFFKRYLFYFVVALGLVNSNKEQPIFAIIGKPILNENKTYLLIRPENKAATKEIRLEVKIGESYFSKAVRINKQEPSLEWIFDITEYELKYFKEGKNTIYFSLPGSNSWDEHSIFISDLDVIFVRDFNEKRTLFGNSNDEPEEYIIIEGICIIDRKSNQIERQAIEMAKRGATIDAQAKLLEKVRKVQITRTTTINDFITSGEVTIAKVEGSIRGTQQVGDFVIAEDYVSVKLKIAMDKIKNLVP